MLFDGIVGNEHVKQQLREALTKGSLAQTVMLAGPAGAGKKALAREAAAVLLEDHRGLALRGEHPDLTEIDEGEAEIKVETARRIRQEAFTSPGEAPRRVFIICHMHNANANTQNALLTLLEEPPSGVVFFLLTENPAQILQTVRSRSLILYTQPPETADALALLRKACPQADAAACDTALKACGGYPEAARAYLEQQGADEGSREKAGELLALLDAGDELKFWSVMSGLEKSKRDEFTRIMNAQRQLLRDELAARAAGEKPRYARLDSMKLLDIAELAGELALRCSNNNVHPAHLCGAYAAAVFGGR